MPENHCDKFHCKVSGEGREFLFNKVFSSPYEVRKKKMGGVVKAIGKCH